jgi:hypothetical protein
LQTVVRSERYGHASKDLTTAISLSTDKEAGSKRLQGSDLAETYCLRGYARVRCYQNATILERLGLPIGQPASAYQILFANPLVGLDSFTAGAKPLSAARWRADGRPRNWDSPITPSHLGDEAMKAFEI